MDDPPHINGSVLQTLLVAGKMVDIFGHQQGLMGCCGLSHSFYGDKKGNVSLLGLMFCIDSISVLHGSYP